MRHLKDSKKFNRTSSHRRSMYANMLKSLIGNESIVTTLAKAKQLRRHADQMITLAKANTLASRRKATAALMVRRNSLTSKEKRAARSGDTSAYNGDRQVVNKLFSELGTRFTNRQGGYTRIIRLEKRVGDNAQKCLIEYLPE